VGNQLPWLGCLWSPLRPNPLWLLGRPPSPRGLPAHLAHALLADAVLAPSSEGVSDFRPIGQALLACRGGPSPCTHCSPLTGAPLTPQPLPGVGSVPTSMCWVQRDPPPPRAPRPPPPPPAPASSFATPAPSCRFNTFITTLRSPPDRHRHAPPHLPVLRSPFPIVVSTAASTPTTTLRHVGSLSTATTAGSWGTPSVFVGPAPTLSLCRGPHSSVRSPAPHRHRFGAVAPLPPRRALPLRPHLPRPHYLPTS
jgi:hypothetical protein